MLSSNVKRLFGALAAAAVGFMISGAVMADPIGGPGSPCTEEGSCQGATYWLQYSGTPISTTSTTETFRVFLTIDTSTLDIAGATAIGAAAVKISSAAALVGATLFSAPGGTGNWNLVAGGINADGCLAGGNGFECADWNGSGVGAAITGTFMTWGFDITILTGSLSSSGEIKVQYVDASGNKVGDLVSEPIPVQIGVPPTEIPEPATLALLGLGLLGIAFSRRRRTR